MIAPQYPLARLYWPPDLSSQLAINPASRSTDLKDMKKFTLFTIFALVFGALGFAFARYCPIGAKLGPAAAHASSPAPTDVQANSNLISQLQTLRSQLELYKLQHNDTLPDFAKYGWKQLTYKTNSKGQISDNAKELSNSLYGPYFIAPPQNPLTKSSEILVIQTLPPGFQATGAYGFVFEECEGRIFALNADGRIFDTSTSTSADAR
jgi:hypothetical protein